MELVLPPDWEQHPELVQALQVLVEGAARSIRGAAAEAAPPKKQQGRSRRSPPATI